jgi:pimeloyl-ACP methyl ester carboxylesterase
MPATQVHILLGGIGEGFFGLPNGWDGPVTSDGMYGLAKQLEALPGVTIKTYDWGDWNQAWQASVSDKSADKIAVIGYSGGGSRATWLANDKSPRIDLMVCYDPSPSWQMLPIGDNVLKAICYHNLNPMMPSLYGMLGGGRLLPSKIAGCKIILTRNISEQHLDVQFDQSLHTATIEAVKELSGG